MRKPILTQVLFFATISLAACSMFEQQYGSMVPSRAISAGADALKAVTLTDRETVEMAHKVAIEMDRNNQIAEEKSVYAKRLKKLVSHLESEDGLKLNFKVYIDPEVNAFSLADGTIRVHSGLMDRMNDEQVFFVIGHEIGHVKSGHAKTRLQRAYAASAATGAAVSYVGASAGGGIGGAAAVVGSDLLGELATEVITSQFSQSDEMESDDYGVYFLARHGKRPEAALDALRTIDEKSASDDGMLDQFVSTHPGGKERIENVGLIIASLGKPGAVQKTQLARAENVELNPPASTRHNNKGKSMPTTKMVSLKSTQPRPELPGQNASGWYIQLAAFPEAAPAESMQGALRDRSERVTVQTTMVKGSQYERVLVGPYPTRKNAVIELNRVISHGIFEGEPFVRRLPN